jgi:DNA-directed RNA polymerase subunit beta'
MLAYQAGAVGIHSPIKVRVTKEIDGVVHTRIIDATVGRIIFNEAIPQVLGLCDRANPETMLDLEITFVTRRNELAIIIERCMKKHGFAESAVLLDGIKALGFKYSTRGAITVSISDMAVPAAKKVLIAEAEAVYAASNRITRWASSPMRSAAAL